MKTAKWLGVMLAATVAVGSVMVINAKAAQVRGAKEQRPAVRAKAAPERLTARIAERLDLSDEQKAGIKGELSGEKETISRLLADVQAARVNLRATIQKPGVSENEVRGASAKLASVEADLAVERSKIYGRISPTLTPDQRAKLDKAQQRAEKRAANMKARVARRAK